MKNIIIACLMFFLPVIHGWPQSPVTSSPRIACASSELNFGNKSQTNIVHYSFIIKNEGQSPLIISRIHACCGANTRLTTNSVPPQTNAVLEMTLSLSGRTGPMHKSIYIHSNDPVNPIYQLKITGNVAAP
ncbi:MAG: DUF1573 domain-containing protein [Kiritimatiellae bacterium]|nr:DUF1573 domain-containing protein [Kiritimatiellia bacterium]